MIHHKDVGPILTSTEWQATDAHVSNYSTATIVVAANDSVDKTKAGVHRWTANDYSNFSSEPSMFNTPNNSYWAQSFAVAGAPRLISKVRWYLKKTGAPAGTLVSRLYVCAGTFESNSTPTGSSVCSSSLVNVTNVSTAEYQPVEFTFSPPYVAAVSNWCVSIEFSDAPTQDASNYISLASDVSGAYNGNASYYASGSWYTLWGVNASDLIFELFSDYTCDGTADEVQINAAINAAAVRGGGSVFLLEGNYSLAASVAMTSNVMLRGQGYGTALTQSSDFSTITMIGTSANTVSNMVVRDLRIHANAPSSGNYAGVACKYCTDSIIDNIFVRNQRYGVYIEGPSSFIKVLNSTFTLNTGAADISPIGGTISHVMIRNCSSYSLSSTAYYINAAYGTAGGNAEYISIMGCNSRDDSGTGIYALGGGYTYMITNLVIQDNVFYNNNNRGIMLYGTGTAQGTRGVQFFSINGNCIYSAPQEGIVVSDVAYGAITGNIVSSCGIDNNNYGIKLGSYASYITCTGNFIAGSGAHGIGVPSYGTELVIANNISLNNGRKSAARAAIACAGQGSTNHIVTGNIVYENPPGVCQYYGIYVPQGSTPVAENMLLANNIALGSSQYGVYQTMGGTNIAYDTTTVSSLYTLGTAQEIPLFTAQSPCQIMRIAFAIATTTTVGLTFSVGHYSATTNLNNYFLSSVGFGARNRGTTLIYNHDDFTSDRAKVSQGDTITLTTNNGGTGAIVTQLLLAQMGDSLI
jgi:hypothetical protein